MVEKYGCVGLEEGKVRHLRLPGSGGHLSRDFPFCKGSYQMLMYASNFFFFGK